MVPQEPSPRTTEIADLRNFGCSPENFGVLPNISVDHRFPPCSKRVLWMLFQCSTSEKKPMFRSAAVGHDDSSKRLRAAVPTCHSSRAVPVWTCYSFAKRRLECQMPQELLADPGNVNTIMSKIGIPSIIIETCC